MSTWQHKQEITLITLRIESDAGFGTASTADDILDFTERNPFGEIDEGQV